MVTVVSEAAEVSVVVKPCYDDNNGGKDDDMCNDDNNDGGIDGGPDDSKHNCASHNEDVGGEVEGDEEYRTGAVEEAGVEVPGKRQNFLQLDKEI